MIRRLIAATLFAVGQASGRMLAALAILGTFALVTQAQEDVPMSLFPLWDRSFSARTGFGYRDNVLFSHNNPRQSAFFSGGLEASAFRLAEDGTHASFLFTADDIHYFSVPQVEDELLIFTQVQLRKPFASAWQAAFSFEYFYQNQVLDVSATELNLRTAEVEAHNFQFDPALRRNIGGAGWLELSAPAARRIFLDPLDSFWESGPKLMLGHSYGRKSEWTVSYSFLDRVYDTRTETTSAGGSVPGTTLEFRQHKFEIGSSHYWDEQRRWRSVTKLSYKINEDNGGGYFNYGRFQISEHLRFRSKVWELLAEARFGNYLFDVQTVSASDPARRELADFIWHLRAERRFNKHLKSYMDFEQGHSFSNQSVERYAVNTVSGGVILEF